MSIINMIKQECINALTWFTLTIVISFFVFVFIKLIIKVCTRINKNKAIKIEKYLNEKISDSGYSLEYIYETGFSDLEDIFCSIVYVYKDGEMFLRHQLNPVKFYFSKESDVINYFLDIISRHEKKNVVLLKELLDVVTEDDLRSYVEFVVEYLKVFYVDEYIEKYYKNISCKEYRKILKLYDEHIVARYMDVYNQLYLNVNNSECKTINRFSCFEEYEAYEGFNYELELNEVLPKEEKKLINMYSRCLCEIIDLIYIKPRFENILEEISKEILKEAVL